MTSWPVSLRASRLADGHLSVYRRGLPSDRGIAQPGSAAVLGTAGRWFESSCPDQIFQILSFIFGVLIFPEN
jgi:hypothetical protein